MDQICTQDVFAANVWHLSDSIRQTLAQPAADVENSIMGNFKAKETLAELASSYGSAVHDSIGSWPARTAPSVHLHAWYSETLQAAVKMKSVERQQQACSVLTVAAAFYISCMACLSSKLGTSILLI